MASDSGSGKTSLSNKQLGEYEILDPLGIGGMGEVYRARDNRLDRQVAIKVLPNEFTEDPERLARFEREAKLLASLNHSNIGAIYGYEEAGGQKFFVLELVEGETLAERLEKGPFPLRDALSIAIQIAEGVEAAHERGVIHRDLKPANVKLTPDGRVKVLDFGLAKALELEEGSPRVDLTRSPTLTHDSTRAGVILGTAPYMSPEQAEGKPLDPRSDIFSFGSLLYEMITGQQAFSGDTQTRVLAAILEKDPKPISDIVQGTPPEVDRIIARCLRKEPGRRFQHVQDLRLTLEDCLHDQEVPSAQKRRDGSVRFWKRTAVALGLLLLLALGLSTYRWSRHRLHHRQPVLSRVTSVSGLTIDPVFSGDGSLLGYASDRSGEGNLDIWIQQIGGGVSRRTAHQADDRQPSFHPDGTKVVFRSERASGGIYWTTTLGDEASPRLVVEEGRRPRVSPDGSLIAYWIGQIGSGYKRGSLYTIPLTGESLPVRLVPDFAVASHPVWSPDGEYILFRGWAEADSMEDEDFDWWMVSLEDGETQALGMGRRLTRRGLSQPVIPSVWVEEGNELIFSATRGDSTNLWQVPVSSLSRSIAGPLEQLTAGVGPELQPHAVASNKVVFSTQMENLDLWSLDIDADAGRVPKGAELKRLTNHAGEDSHPSLSTDGNKVAFVSTRSGNPDIWLMDLQTQAEINLTATPGDERWPKTGLTGSRVAYGTRTRSDEDWTIYTVETEGDLTRRKSCGDCGRPLDWCSTGDYILYVRGQSNQSVWMLEEATSKKVKLLEHPEFDVVQARPDPFDRWVAFTVEEEPLRARVYIAPFQTEDLSKEKSIPTSQWMPVTDGERWDGMARWSPNGNFLYFVSDREGSRGIWVQRLEPGSKKPLGEPRLVRHFEDTRLSLSGVSPGSLRINVAQDKIVFTLREMTGDVWLVDLSSRE